MGYPKIITCYSLAFWLGVYKQFLYLPFWLKGALAVTVYYRRTGGIHMVEQRWTRFASTGSVQDYLSYKCHQTTEGACGYATLSLMADREYRSGSVGKNGAEHSAYGHGFISSPSGRI